MTTKALKEWSTVISALGEGKQIILLRRKGGLIFEEQGLYKITPDIFALYPTYTHPKDSFKAHHHNLFEESLSSRPQSGGVRVKYLAKCEDIIAVDDLESIKKLSTSSIWTKEYLEKYFRESRGKKIFVIIVRVYKFPELQIIEEAKGITWVNLPYSIPIDDCCPVLGDKKFLQKKAAIKRIFAGKKLEKILRPKKIPKFTPEVYRSMTRPSYHGFYPPPPLPRSKPATYPDTTPFYSWQPPRSKPATHPGSTSFRSRPLPRSKPATHPGSTSFRSRPLPRSKPATHPGSTFSYSIWPMLDRLKASVEPPPRYADFAFYEEGGQEVPEGYMLQAKKWYQLEVAVRIEPRGIRSHVERTPIRIPKQKEDVTIMVCAEAEDEKFIEIAEPVQTLTLPPFGDSSENALFRVRAQRQSTSVHDLAEIKIRLYYEFNLIEVAVIRAEIAGKFDDPSQSQLGLEKPISFRQDRLEREYIDLDNVKPRAMHIDITKRKDEYLFNFAFCNDVDQKVVFTAPARLTPDDLEDALMKIRGIWYNIAMSEIFTTQLEGDKDAFLDDVRKLAKAGRGLWIKLFKRESKSSLYKIGTWLERHPLKPEGIVQVTLDKDAANFVFPWALLYDRSVPMRNYELPDPEGFWGLRYCIEQQVSQQRIKGAEECLHIPEKLKLGFMLWDQFRNADSEKTLMQSLMERSAGTLEVSAPPIDNAKACYDLLSACDAHVLYFYTHGYTRHRRADIGVGQTLELFKERYERLAEDSPLRETYRLLYESIADDQFELDRSWIELTYGKLYLDELIDYISDLQSRPFIILNMCESAQVTPSLSESFIQFFLDRGARGVIGTECPMTIEFAHPFAKKFLEDILTGKKVGVALLNARRHFVELKNPLGLAYTLFGSATVCFAPPRF